MPLPDAKNNKKYLLQESKNFCMMPWVHLHFLPDGGAHACCLSDSTKPFGNFKDTPEILSLWNSENAKALRKGMLEDQPSELCKRCYELESHGVYTLRKMANESFGKDFDESLAGTQKDGELTDPKMKYLDMRFSNVCNFKCSTCGPQFSSSWYDDQKKLFPEYNLPKLTRVEPADKLMQQLDPLLKDVEKTYFAGGEPILTEEIYAILEKFIERKQFDVNITFTTNFSKIALGKKNILEYWKKFKDVRISASLDASFQRGEYLRKGTRWSEIESNRLKMKSTCPEVYFEISPTISVFNVWHFPDFHLDWVERELVAPNHVRVNLLTNPDYMSISLIPVASRQPIIEKWKRTRDQLVKLSEKSFQPVNNIEMGYNAIINSLENSPYNDLWKMFWTRTLPFDFIRGDNLLKAFPEFKEVYQIEPPPLPEFSEIERK